jgi:exonuclease III
LAGVAGRSSHDEESITLRLISWNVNGRYGAALGHQIAAVVGRRPDLVALQEVRAESLPTWLEGLARGGL